MLRRLYNQHPKVLVVIIFVLLAVFSAMDYYWLRVFIDNAPGYDFQIYVNALNDVLNEKNPYIPYGPGHFLYNPFTLVIIDIISLLPFLNTFIWFSLFSTLAWVLSVNLSYLLTSDHTIYDGFSQANTWKRNAIIVGSIVFYPFIETLHFGQVNTIVVFFILSSLYLNKNNRPISSGTLLSISIIFKTSPAIFVLYYLLKRNYKVVISTLISYGLFSVFAIQYFGGEVSLIYNYIGVAYMLSNEIFISSWNQSIVPMIFALLEILGINCINGTSLAAECVENPLFNTITLIPKVISGIVLLIISTISLIDDISDYNREIVSIFFILMMISSPLVWLHHSVLLAYPIVYTISQGDLFESVFGVIMIFGLQIDRFVSYIMGLSGIPFAGVSAVFVYYAFLVFFMYRVLNYSILTD
jgi:hypothetical protein